MAPGRDLLGDVTNITGPLRIRDPLNTIFGGLFNALKKRLEIRAWEKDLLMTWIEFIAENFKVESSPPHKRYVSFLNILKQIHLRRIFLCEKF